MWVTVVETDSFHWVALGETRKESRAAWSEGFRRHIAEQYADAADDWIRLVFDEEAPIDFYAGKTYQLKTGECLRDGVRV